MKDSISAFRTTQMMITGAFEVYHYREPYSKSLNFHNHAPQTVLRLHTLISAFLANVCSARENHVDHTLLILCAVEENILRVRRFPNGTYSGYIQS